MTLNMTGLGQGRPPPPKKEEVIPRAQVVDPKTQVVRCKLQISVPKFDYDNDNAETNDEDEDVYRFWDDNDSQDDDKGDFFVINDDHYCLSFLQKTNGDVF
jgi:hypothetical protein